MLHGNAALSKDKAVCNVSQGKIVLLLYNLFSTYYSANTSEQYEIATEI